MKLPRLLALLLFSLPAFAAHSVTLSWDASVSPNITQYRIYHSAVSGGPYKYYGAVAGTTLTGIVAKSPDNVSLLQDGATYFYVVTAFDGAVESVTSVEVSATIPAAPKAPTNLKAVVK